jgi:hypothetical protein
VELEPGQVDERLADPPERVADVAQPDVGGATPGDPDRPLLRPPPP